MFIVMNEELPEKVTNYKRTYGKVKKKIKSRMLTKFYKLMEHKV